MLKRIASGFLLFSLILIPSAVLKTNSAISSPSLKRPVKKISPHVDKSTLVCGTNGCRRVILTGTASSALTPLQAALRTRNIDHPSDISLEINKSQRLMKLFVNGSLVKSYPVALGKQPDGPKIRRGDRRTPEGTYYVCEKNPRSRFYLALKLSYPNINDAHRGLKDGLINQSVFNRIVSSIQNRGVPPMNTKLGGNICIHSGGAGRLRYDGDSEPYIDIRDWTAGCVALGKNDIRELFNFIPVGAPVRIHS